MKNSIKIVLILLFPLQLFAQTIISGTIDQNTTLTKVNSPYLINSTLIIAKETVLTIEAGCVISISENVEIQNNGTLNAIGTITDSIFFKSENPNLLWFRLTGNYSQMTLEYVKLTDAQQAINENYGNFIIKNSVIKNIRGYDVVAIHYSSRAEIDKCKLLGVKGIGKVDAIDCDGVENLFITHNEITNWDDDAIDIGTQTKNAYVAYNFVSNCDYGLSVGESSNAFAERNVFIRNHGGFQSHTGAILNADHNTLYQNDFGIQCYHGGDLNSGGNAEVSNTIFSNCLLFDYQVQTSSTLNITYSLSENEILLGSNNIVGNPNFVDTANLNFNILELSDCINTGNPNFEKDLDGSITDIGRYAYSSSLSVEENKVSEKAYLFYPNPNSGNFIIKSNSNSAINSVQLFNINAQLIFETQQVQHEISIKNLKKGIYFCKITINYSIFTEKIIVN